MRTAKRLQTVKEYYFSQKLREIATLKAQGHDILNLAIGSPDLPPHPSVIDSLKTAASAAGNNGYQPYQGLPELRHAIADFYVTKYDVSLNARDEILPLMGSKEGITHISMAYLDAGDRVLVPELAYPTYQAVAEMAEAVTDRYPLSESTRWEPDWSYFDRIDPQTKILWINYPHMPTGTGGTKEWLEKFVNISKEKDLLLVHDNPYSFVLNDQPRSIFSIAGAKEVAIELNSLSKTFNMAGWRVGWACGSKSLLEPVLRIKSNMDSGMYAGIQHAAIKALQLPDQWYVDLNKEYASRREKVFEWLDHLGCNYDTAQQGMFVWAQVSGRSGDTLVDELLYDHHIFITPGKVFGEAGKNYIRVSLCSPVVKFEEAIKRVKS